VNGVIQATFYSTKDMALVAHRASNLVSLRGTSLHRSRNA